MDTKQPAPLTPISNALINEDVDKALYATAKLMLHNIRYIEVGSKDYTVAVASLGKLLIEIKKSKPTEPFDKEAIMKEMEAWLLRDNHEGLL